jgi:FkbM family methyltransferase
MDRSWKILSFEANPDIYASYLIKKYGSTSVDVRNVAVSDEDAKVEFHLSSDSSGSSLSRRVAALSGATLNKFLAGHRGPITDENSDEFQAYTSGASRDVVVQSIDMARFLEEFVAVDDYVVMKLDIEGGEYRVLRHLLNKHVAKRIDLLYVEFHDRFFPDESPETNADLLNALSQAGTLVIEWN